LRRLGRADHFARENELLGLIGADQPRQPLGPPESRYESEIDLRQPEPGILGGVDEIAGQRDFAAASEREAVHGGDHGDRQLLQLRNDGMPGARKDLGLQRRKGCQLRDVRSGHKCFLTGAGQNQHPNAFVRGNVVQRLGKFRQQGLVQGVQRLGPVEGDRCNPLIHLEQNVCVGHDSPSRKQWMGMTGLSR
jgi:hypothetical protein